MVSRLAVTGGFAMSVLVGGCGTLLPGAPNDDVLLEGPVEDLSSQQLAAFLAGDGEFSRRFAPADGLGPIFVATSCESCHVGDGKGHPLFNLKRFGRMEGGVFNPMRADGGPQVQNRAILNYMAEVVPAGITGVAQFTAPSVTGLGFLEAVEDAAILALADPNDADGDGISGRVQLLALSDLIAEVTRLELLFDADEPGRHIPIDGRYIGRFGKKASAVNLLHQTVTAYREDMGLTSDLIPEDPINPQVGNFAGDGVPDPEVPSSTVSNVVFYLKTLRPPPRRDAESPAVKSGEALFTSLGCARCHVPALTTGASRIAALDRKVFYPYTDLLLHDMGPELDDKYTEGIALTSEWRTAPLWGIGLAERSQGGRAFYLHDGRARTLREAIELHGGEAAASRQAFRALTPAEQELLLAFLRSL
ncbi:MAG: thiol oxidoreductase [Gemmatimonadales bacterium]|nr:thiol oxidoreductase [Gemmatimonadales bacterium]